MKIAVTGGAGFIGSHLVDKLLAEAEDVLVIDDLSSGRMEYINKKAKFIKKDIRTDLSTELKEIETVFHLASDPEVRSSAIDPIHSFDINVNGTVSILEACRKADVKHIVFTSTSTVYGDASIIPTSEIHPCAPISNYGASKLACEGYLSSYSSSYDIKCTSLRYANIFGERSLHGVMYDFFHKLKNNKKELEILGNGKQDKSYLYVSDCVSATITSWKKQKARYDVFNVGSRKKITVNEIAQLMCNLLIVKPKFYYTGTARGWVGDVPLMLLDTSKLEKLGWRERVTFEDGIKGYLTWLEKSS